VRNTAPHYKSGLNLEEMACSKSACPEWALNQTNPRPASNVDPLPFHSLAETAHRLPASLPPEVCDPDSPWLALARLGGGVRLLLLATVVVAGVALWMVAARRPPEK